MIKEIQIISAGFFPMEEEEPVATFTASPVTPDPGWEQTDGEMTEYTYNEYGGNCLHLC